MRRALAIDEASLGADHPTVAIHLSNLARLMQDTNRLAEAEPLIRRAVAIDEASLGADHPNVATDLINLASLLYTTDRTGEAEPLIRCAVVIYLSFERQTGHTHRYRDIALVWYRDILTAGGRDEAAVQTAIESARQEAGLG
jgi:hypothetical protein